MSPNLTLQKPSDAATPSSFFTSTSTQLVQTWQNSEPLALLRQYLTGQPPVLQEFLLYTTSLDGKLHLFLIKTSTSLDVGVYSNVPIDHIDVLQHCESLVDALGHRHEPLPTSFVGDAWLAGPLAQAIAHRKSVEETSSCFFKRTEYSTSPRTAYTATVLFPGANLAGVPKPVPEVCQVTADDNQYYCETLLDMFGDDDPAVPVDFAYFHAGRVVSVAWLASTAIGGSGGKRLLGLYTVPDMRRWGFAAHVLGTIIHTLLETGEIGYLSMMCERDTATEDLCDKFELGSDENRSYVLENYEVVKTSRFGRPEVAFGAGIAAVVGWWVYLV
ncbi:hypothetical protein BZA05DRAFT_420786 [Tricharina praecox]|uniref:uncharacterized protein n=1 Tax=Tricharina praecox TaxID=43433 RepID=UPI00221FF469|nr:uncharacterized protein BZA05DRAFT_420786 [Tricharina praecox]KAI5846960.1 hypothetical protein BZA05DRAFT_420786 [Tricharina praecox]